MNIAYLSCPYFHPDPKIKKERHAIANRVTFNLMRQQVLVYSPLTHNIPIDQLGIHGDWTTWKNFDHEMLSRCDRLIVLMLPGWDESKGVAAEIAQANLLGIPVEWMQYDENEESSLNNLNDQNGVEELIGRMLTFYSDREWDKFHSPKNLAMNLGVEVGELMEHFRWLTEAQSFIEAPEDLIEIQDELGDVFLVLLHLSHTLGLDPFKAAHEKLTKIGIKYPIDKCKGLCHKYTKYQ